jgi:hypothetical protein
VLLPAAVDLLSFVATSPALRCCSTTVYISVMELRPLPPPWYDAWWCFNLRIHKVQMMVASLSRDSHVLNLFVQSMLNLVTNDLFLQSML